MRVNLLYLLIIFLASCKPSMICELSYIKSNEKVTLFLLDAEESMNTEQNLNYIDNRRILKSYKISAKEQKELISEILKKNNYEPVTRKCKFEPIYALKIGSQLIGVFDIEYCPGFRYISEKGVEEYVQIKSNSQLSYFIKELTKYTTYNNGYK